MAAFAALSFLPRALILRVMLLTQPRSKKTEDARLLDAYFHMFDIPLIVNTALELLINKRPRTLDKIRDTLIEGVHRAIDKLEEQQPQEPFTSDYGSSDDGRTMQLSRPAIHEYAFASV